MSGIDSLKSPVCVSKVKPWVPLPATPEERIYVRRIDWSEDILLTDA